jgi:biotin transport system substrate-specific component
MASSSKHSVLNSLINSKNPLAKKLTPTLTKLSLIIIGSVLLAISAQYKVPLGPVPITLQSMVVMLIASMYGWKLGAATILAYWVEGVLVGGVFSFLPWFANGSGLLYFLTSPSAGFLWGFLPMVVIIGYLNDQLSWRQNPVSLFFSLLIGQGALYTVGIGYAYFVIMPFVDWMNSSAELLAIFVTPFIIGDILKTAIAAVITLYFIRMSNKILS